MQPVGLVVFYALLVGIAGVWAWLRHQPFGTLLMPGTPTGWLVELSAGLGVAFTVIGIGRFMEKSFEFARRLSREIRELLPPLSSSDIILMAVCSSVGEEVLFRGAMQTSWGFWTTALVFAVVHGFFVPRYWAWMVFAGIMGVVFGWMVLIFGTLLAPVAAHFTINAVNLHFLNQARDLEVDVSQERDVDVE